MTRASFLGLGFLALVAGSVANSMTNPAAPTIITFDHMEPGHSPEGFTIDITGGGGPASWLVQEDGSAPNGKQVLVQTSADIRAQSAREEEANDEPR